MSIEQALILAGGKGTRLRQRLGDLPKPLIDVAGTPLLERQILLLKRYGFKRINILVNYQADKIVRFCQSHSNWDLDIRCIDDGEPLGTAGAVIKILDQLDDDFLVVYGDTMLEIDLHRFSQFHEKHPHSAGTIFLHPNDHPQDSDLVELDQNNCVAAFHPYPRSAGRFLPNLVNAALYILRRDSLKPWQHDRPKGLFDFGKNLFPSMLEQGKHLIGYNSPEYIKDCGTPDRLDKVTQDLISGRIETSSLLHKQPTVFIDRDGTLNEEVDHLHHADQLVLFDGVQEAVRRLNLSKYRTCIVTNQPVVARGQCSPEELQNIHNKLESLLGEKGAFVDRIYFCPHHPESGFTGEISSLKCTCTCRKPAIGLVECAVSELNSDLQESWFIGDTTTDVETAHRAGLRSILVETGYAGLDHKFPKEADFTVPNFVSAVDFILDIYPSAMRVAKALSAEYEGGDLIMIGGQARSGKTTAANILRIALEDQGKRVHVLSTDRWLHSSENRSEGVLGRHDINSLQKLVAAVAQPRHSSLKVRLPAYQKKSRVSVPDASEVTILQGDIVIIEGVVALTLDTGEFPNVHRFAVSIDEGDRRKRFISEYLRREGSIKEAKKLYSTRRSDEYDVVQSSLRSAQVIRLHQRAAQTIQKP